MRIFNLIVFLLSNTLIALHFDIIITSYNNERWVEPNLASVSMQTYSDYHIYYVDDCSTDNTVYKVQQCLERYNIEKYCTLIVNEKRTYKLYNLYNAIHAYCDDDHVIVEIDGDDWLLDENFLEDLNHLYTTHNILLTAGGFVAWPCAPSYLNIKPLMSEVITTNSFRKVYLDNPIFMAARSYFSFLFKRIDKQDLVDENGKFYKRSSDVLTMIPMFEMAGDRFEILTKPYYLYNTNTGHNDYQEDPLEQNFIYKLVALKCPYRRLNL